MSYLKRLKSKIDYYPEYKKGIDDVYSSFASDFEEIGNSAASKGYHFCVRINKHLGPYAASWVARHVVDLFIQREDWEILTIRYHYEKDVASKTLEA